METKVVKEILAWLEKCPTEWEWSSSTASIMHVKIAMWKDKKSDDDKK